MSDSQPLFGEESAGSKVFTVLIIVLLAVWCTFCVALGIAFGVLNNFSNILLAVTVILAGVSSILMFKWWREADLDPKFRVLLLLLVVQVLVLGIAININVWTRRGEVLRPADFCIYQNGTTFGSNVVRNPVFVASRPDKCYDQALCPRGCAMDLNGDGVCRPFNSTFYLGFITPLCNPNYVAPTTAPALR